MRVIPEKKVERLGFCEVHAEVWASDPAAVGLTAEQCAAFAALTAEARAARDAAIAAQQAARAAVVRQDAALQAAARRAADLVRLVKAHAAMRPEPDAVLAAAQIPLKAQARPARAPGRPEGVSVSLRPDGAVTLAWRARDAAAGTGAFFDVLRKLPGGRAGGGFVSIGTAPGTTGRSRTMRFTDASLPGGLAAGGAGAEYIIVGRRGALRGPASSAIAVRFGGGGVAEGLRGVGDGGGEDGLRMAG